MYIVPSKCENFGSFFQVFGSFSSLSSEPGVADVKQMILDGRQFEPVDDWKLISGNAVED